MLSLISTFIFVVPSIRTNRYMIYDNVKNIIYDNDKQGFTHALNGCEVMDSSEMHTFRRAE
jgi:hypothetical protein